MSISCIDCTCAKQRCQESEPLEGKEIRTLLVVTFSFLAVFTAFNALQNLHSSLHDEESLGLVCLSIIYGTGIVSSVIAPTLIGIAGAKMVLVISFTAHCVYILANFYPSFATMVPAALLLGAFHGPAWTAQALYISACSFSYSKSSSTSPYTILTRFNGFFFAIFASTQIGGNLVTSTVIRDGVGNQSEMVIFKYCGSNDCPANENATEIVDPEDWVIDITLGFYMGCALCGLFLAFFLLSPLPQSEWVHKVKVQRTATSCLNVLISTNMILLVPFIMFTSMEHALLLGAFTKSYVACPIGIHMVGYVMAVYGATTPVFVLIFTRLARVTGRFVLIVAALFIHLFILIMLYQWVPTAEEEALIFIVPMVWGVAESILQAQANALIAMLYPSQKEPAFANFHAWRNVGYTITFLNVSYLCVSTKLIIAMICLVLGLILYIFVEVKTKMREKLLLTRPPVVLAPVEEVISENRPVYRNSTSMVSLTSIQDRLSFDRVELRDIIKEAEMGWKRDPDGPKLELHKVMSKEHLSESKVTSWYHIRPVSDNKSAVNSDFPYLTNGSAFPRSRSDGHLHSLHGRVELRNKQRLGYDRSVSCQEPQLRLSQNSRLESNTLSSYVIPEEDHEDIESNSSGGGNVFIEFTAPPSPRLNADSNPPNTKNGSKLKHIMGRFLSLEGTSRQSYNLETLNNSPSNKKRVVALNGTSPKVGKKGEAPAVVFLNKKKMVKDKTQKHELKQQIPSSFNSDGGQYIVQPSHSPRVHVKNIADGERQSKIMFQSEPFSAAQYDNNALEVEEEYDSDGFVDDEQLEQRSSDGSDIENGDFSHMYYIRRMSRVPVSESEDVNAIY